MTEKAFHGACEAVDRRTAARQRTVFLRALRRTGLIKLAVEQTGTGRRWLDNERRASPVFSQQCQMAIAAAKSRAAGGKDPHAPGMQAGRSGGRAPRLTRWDETSYHRWTPEHEDSFIEHLACTGNVLAACAEVGFASSTVYRRRMEDPAFVERWDLALRQGYARVEAALVEWAGRAIGAADVPSAKKTPPISFGDALNLLKWQDAKASRQKLKPWQRPPDPDAARAELLKLVLAVKRANEANESAAWCDYVPSEGAPAIDVG